MTAPEPVLYAVGLSAEHLAGLRGALLEAITSAEFDIHERALASALRDGLAKIEGLRPGTGRSDWYALLLPAEHQRVAVAAIEHVQATMRPFEMPMRVALDQVGVESLGAVLRLTGSQAGSEI